MSSPRFIIYISPLSRCIKRISGKYFAEGFELAGVRLRPTPDSSCFAKVGYSQKTRVLAVQFRESGRTYFYYDVEPELWRSFVSASSLGRFYNEEIKWLYIYEALEIPNLEAVEERADTGET